MPPIWAIAAMVVLGWNEFFTALRNPLWLIGGVVLFLFFKVSSLTKGVRGHSLHLQALAGLDPQCWVSWTGMNSALDIEF